MASVWVEWGSRIASGVVLCGAAMLSACGGGGGDGQPPPASGATVGAEYFPLAVGDRWVYREWDDIRPQASSSTLVKAAGSSVLWGRPAVAVETSNAGTGQVLSTQYLSMSAGTLSELADPQSGATQDLSIDLLRFPLTVGQSFVQYDQSFSVNADYDGDGRSESVRVLGQVTVVGLETVQTDVGAMSNAAHVRTVITQTAVYTGRAPVLQETYTVDAWYAAGIGLVREDVSIVGAAYSMGNHKVLTGYAVGNRRSDSAAPAATLVSPSATSGRFTRIQLQFDKPMDPTTFTSQAVELRDAAGSLLPVAIYSVGVDWTFHPAAGPLPSGAYTVTLTNLPTDLLGNAAATQSWAFQVDATSPTVVATSPANGARYVSLQSAITIDFSEEIDPATVAGNVTLSGFTDVPVDVSVDGRRLTIRPPAALWPDSTYVVQIQSLLTDRHGNPLSSGHTLSFRTDPGVFDYPVSYSAGALPEAVAAGDVTGDGRVDVVMTSSSNGDPATDFKLFVFSQRADGSLSPTPVMYDTRSTYTCRPRSVAVGDVNGDGRDDVLLGEGSCGIEVFLQDASGRLVSSTFLGTPEGHRLRLRDMNADGRLDIVSVGWATDQVAVWLQRADRSFAAPALYPLAHGGYEDLDIGDVNGDGRLDIVVASVAPGKVGVLTQLADGSFGNALTILRPEGGMPSVAIGDVNGDGRHDLVVNRPGAGTLSVFLQTAQGTLAAAPDLPVTSQGVAIEIADVDGDGRQDIVLAGGSFGVMLAQSGGTFGPLNILQGSESGNFNPESLVVTDVNSDGRPDLVGAGITVAVNRGGVTAALAASSGRLMVGGRSWRLLKTLPTVGALPVRPH